MDHASRWTRFSAYLRSDKQGIRLDAEQLRMMSSYYHPAKEADMAAMTEPLCLERGNALKNNNNLAAE